MYPGEAFAGGIFGFAGFGLTAPEGEAIAYAEGAYTYWTDFYLSSHVAATAATIVSGAVAERIKLESFLLFAMIFVAISYPITGMWHWGGGWLSELGFYDFAGSTLVHAVGGWGALAAVMILGPRKGKYVDGKIRPIPGHSMPLAAMGVFFLWFGWFVFQRRFCFVCRPKCCFFGICDYFYCSSSGSRRSIFRFLLDVQDT